MEKLYDSTRKLISTEISKALSHCRARSRLYNNILFKVWKLYQEDWKRTEDPSTQLVTLVELFLFWIEGHEDMRRLHSWDVSSWMYAIGYPMLDVLMWTVVWIGVAVLRVDYSNVDVAVTHLHLQWEEENSTFPTESWRHIFLSHLKLQEDEACQSTHQMDLWIYVMPISWDFICCDQSVFQHTKCIDPKSTLRQPVEYIFIFFFPLTLSFGTGQDWSRWMYFTFEHQLSM